LRNTYNEKSTGPFLTVDSLKDYYIKGSMDEAHATLAALSIEGAAFERNCYYKQCLEDDTAMVRATTFHAGNEAAAVKYWALIRGNARSWAKQYEEK
jgi:hypothetical protein